MVDPSLHAIISLGYIAMTIISLITIGEIVDGNKFDKMITYNL